MNSLDALNSPDAPIGAAADAAPCVVPLNCSSGRVITCSPQDCVVICENTASWTAAETLCVTAGGNLLTVEDLSESDCVGAAMSAGERAWIGYYQDPGDPEPNGGWEWISGIVSTYQNWLSGQPNNPTDQLPGGQDCAFIEGTSGEWYDHECTSGFRYICEL